MKHLQFNKNGINHQPIKHWRVDDVTEVAIYQGERGERPDLDFIVKYKEEGKRLRTPSHTHWIVDLLVKSEVSKENLLSFVNDMIKIYDETVPFQSVEERNNYLLKFPTQMVTKHSTLQGHGYYSIQTLTTFIELFSKCEISHYRYKIINTINTFAFHEHSCGNNIWCQNNSCSAL